MVARRIDPSLDHHTIPNVTDPVAEASDTIFINLWLNRQAKSYTDLLITIT